MWSAIKSDLFDFVDTIKNDTTKTISKVIGEKSNDDDDEDSEVTIRQKALLDLRRSYNTYSCPIEQQNAREFEKYLRNFSLSSKATEISDILDQEQDVARFYTELVPIQIKPEEFWARYFYRNLLLTRNGVVNLDDDDDDDDEGWESTEKLEEKTNNNDKINKNDDNSNDIRIDGRTIHDIYNENMTLKNHITTLTLHIADLEKQLETAKQALSSSQLQLQSQIISQPSSTPITTVNEKLSSISSSSNPIIETLSDKSESSCVIVESPSSSSSIETKKAPDKVKILANLEDNDDDDDDDEWS